MNWFSATTDDFLTFVALFFQHFLFEDVCNSLLIGERFDEYIFIGYFLIAIHILVISFLSVIRYFKGNWRQASADDFLRSQHHFSSTFIQGRFKTVSLFEQDLMGIYLSRIPSYFILDTFKILHKKSRSIFERLYYFY